MAITGTAVDGNIRGLGDSTYVVARNSKAIAVLYKGTWLRFSTAVPTLLFAFKVRPSNKYQTTTFMSQ